MRRWLYLLLSLSLTTLGIGPADMHTTVAQADCGVATVVDFPMDPASFKLVQAFGVPSPRHQGRYHTGEDWHLGRGQSVGQPVRAIADGRVTYSYPLGWGRDGGVVILAHAMPDGTTVYSQYGHMAETDAVKFPARQACIQRGDVIGTIGDSRPAPHLHWEIRVSNPDTPGPGYTWDDPYIDGWRNPSQFVLSAQAAAHPAFRWQLTALNAAGFSGPPLPLSDDSLMLVDGAQLRLATPDGRILWRVRQESPPVAILPGTSPEGYPLLMAADGRVTQLDFDGAARTAWRAPVTPGGPPLAADTAGWLVPTSEGSVARLSADARETVWALDRLPQLRAAAMHGDRAALLTESRELWLVDAAGAVIHQARLRGPAALAFDPGDPDGALLVFGRGGLWRVDAAGTWALAHPTARALDGEAALLADAGRLLAYDGATLRAYDRAADALAERWALALNLGGRVTLIARADHTLALSSAGGLAVVDAAGRLCSALRLYGDDRAPAWATFGRDGLLRVALADQVTGLDWAALTAPCTT